MDTVVAVSVWTTTVPTIHGCTLQWYGYTPAVSKVLENVVPAINKPLSKFPSGSPDAELLVTKWAVVSSLDHVTSPPTSIVTVLGTKHRSVSSQPGTEEPAGTLTDAANAFSENENNPSETMKKENTMRVKCPKPNSWSARIFR